MIIPLQITDSTAINTTQNSDSGSFWIFTLLIVIVIIICILMVKLYLKNDNNSLKNKEKLFDERIQLKQENQEKQGARNQIVKPKDEKAPIKSKGHQGLEPKELQNEKSQIIVEEEPQKEEKKGIKQITYKPSTAFNQDNPYVYPVVKFPKENSPIKFPKNGRSNKIGYKEDDFYILLMNYFSTDYKVFNDKHIPQQNNLRPYEPDFIIVKETNRDKIFINIEIDEPYEGLSKTPTHIINQDIYRDLFFTNRGYIVIRFTERQIHLAPLACCSYIADVIKSIDATFKCEPLEAAKNTLEKEEQWDGLQAKKWAFSRYRENYLGIDNFGVREDLINDIKSINTEEDEIIESLISPPILDVSVGIKKDYLEHKHSHPRDKRIKFIEKEHKYLIDNNPDTISVSQLIDRFFPEFDSFAVAARLNPHHEYYGLDVNEIVAIWNQNGLDKAKLGTVLHTEIENYYNKKHFNANTPEFLHFQNFINRFPTMNPFRTEWRIFDEDLMIAGTIDMVYKKENGEYFMFDWKRSEKVVDKMGKVILSDPKYQYTKFAFGELNHLTDDSYNKYLLQQNIYRHILEKKYNITISSMNLLILHPNYGNYHLVNLPKLEHEINYIFETSKFIT